MKSAPDSILTSTVVFLALLALTALTVLVAAIELGALGLPVALLIAFVKVLLVALYFMHLRWSRGIIRVVAGGGLLWLVVLLVLAVIDAVMLEG